MLTNILASVVITLITNVTTGDNSKGCSMYQEGFSHLVYGHDCRPYVPPTERYVTTNIVEHTEVTVPLPRGVKVFTQDITVSSVTEVLKQVENWKSAGVKTNDLTQRSITLTNTIGLPYYDDLIPKLRNIQN